MSKPYLCLYHNNCADGITAAWVVKHRLSAETEFVAVNYGEPPPIVHGRSVWIVDFSYPRQVLQDMAQEAYDITVLDHHVSAQREISDLEAANMRIVFDMQRSGAQLTWDVLVGEGRTRPKLVEYTADRDLWRHGMWKSRAANAYIQACSFDLDTWDKLGDEMERKGIDWYAERGEAILLHVDKTIGDLVKLARPVRIGGHPVSMVNAPFNYSSEVGHELAKIGPFGVTYCDVPDGRIYSLRSTPGGVDVSTIAKLYGGGGHRNAAGFKVGHDFTFEAAPAASG